MRIRFAPGAISTQVGGSLPPGAADRYVVNAFIDQETTVYLTFPAGTDPADPDAILVIWGDEDTVLISDHADATQFIGTLPFTQEYIIGVRSRAQKTIEYNLEVIIPPLE